MLGFLVTSSRIVLLHLTCLGLVTPFTAFGICQCAHGESCCSVSASDQGATCCSATVEEQTPVGRSCCKVPTEPTPTGSCTIAVNQCCTHCYCSGPAETAIPVPRITESSQFELESLTTALAACCLADISLDSPDGCHLALQGTPPQHPPVRLHALYDVWLN